MNIDLLSKMIAELILDHDEVSLPGIGTFIAEYTGASFSDKGFTINPPYRKLSFRSREKSSDLLVDFYSSSNGIEKSEARKVITSFVAEMKDILLKKKVMVFPGLGRLRATKENILFFVPDEELDIYPEGFGLTPVSLKRHGEETEDKKHLPEEILSAPVLKNEPAPEAKVSATKAPETKAPETKVLETKVPDPKPATPVKPSTHTSNSRHLRHHKKSAMPAALKVFIFTAAAVALMLGALALMGRYAPEWADKLLYTPEERELLYRR